ncbi:hypothetical protein Tco_0414404, partial [Tanacetum coccineum]
MNQQRSQWFRAAKDSSDAAANEKTLEYGWQELLSYLRVSMPNDNALFKFLLKTEIVILRALKLRVLWRQLVVFKATTTDCFGNVKKCQNGGSKGWVTDDGKGMDPEGMRRCLSFVFSDKSLITTIGKTEGSLNLGPERPRVYSDLSQDKKDRYNADIRTTNIILQGLPKDIYSLINHYTDAKDIWDNVKMLLEGS